MIRGGGSENIQTDNDEVLMRLFGPPDVLKMEAARNTGGLVKALRYKEELQTNAEVTLRRRAAEALGRSGDPQAVQRIDPHVDCE